MRPSVSVNEFLTKLLTHQKLVLTEKARQCVVESLSLGWKENHCIFDDTLMRGFIRARSVALPVLDTIGIDVGAFARWLKRDPAGYDYVLSARGIHHFDDEYSALKDPKNWPLLQLCRMLSLAQAMARRERRKVIDSGLLLRSLLQGALESRLTIPPARWSVLTSTTLSGQIDSLMKACGHLEHDGHSMADLLEVICDEFDEANPLLFKIAPFLKTLDRLRGLEHLIAFAKNVEPYIETERLLLLPGKDRFIAVPFDYLNVYEVKDQQVMGGSGTQPLPPLAKINVFYGAGHVRWKYLEEFEELISNQNVTEWDLQRFFERNPSFLTTGDHWRLHSQIVLAPDDERRPDFFAERLTGSFADIIELKKPSARLISGKSPYKGFSAELTRALNQAREYRNFFDDAHRRKEFLRRYGFQAFRPTVSIVIGRSSDFESDIERIKIEDEYKNIRIQTYDDILRRVRQLTIA